MAIDLDLGPEPLPLEQNEYGDIRVGGTRVTLDSVLVGFKRGEPPEKIRDAFPTLELADIYTVCGYYLRHKAEVDAYLAEREAEYDRLAQEFHRQNPGLRERLLSRLGQRAAPRD